MRKLLFGGLKSDDIQRLAVIYDHTMPDVLDEPVWPPPDRER